MMKSLYDITIEQLDARGQAMPPFASNEGLKTIHLTPEGEKGLIEFVNAYEKHGHDSTFGALENMLDKETTEGIIDAITDVVPESALVWGGISGFCAGVGFLANKALSWTGRIENERDQATNNDLTR
jgi:hypothetical protein